MLGRTRPREEYDAGWFAADAALPRVLVVDDDDLHRMIICRTAAKAGYVPAEASGYEEAAALLQAEAFDCITLDLSLGEHVGVEMLRHLSAIGCAAPIIIISGCDGETCRDTVHLANLLKLNVRQPVPKPVDLVVLRYSLEQLTRQRESAGQR